MEVHDKSCIVVGINNINCFRWIFHILLPLKRPMVESFNNVPKLSRVQISNNILQKEGFKYKIYILDDQMTSEQTHGADSMK